MTREWKPGDIALVRLASRDKAEPAVFQGDVWAVRAGYTAEPVEEPRPLVVIDPEDESQIDRLADLIRDHHGPQSEVRVALDWLDLQAALREFANPPQPKPDEPLGLGAVVEDAYGQRWVRATNFTTVRHWRGCDDHRQGRRRWDEIAAVRVLSPGWTEGEAAE